MQAEEIKDKLFTAWFRVKNQQLYIITDYIPFILESYTAEGIPCHIELVADLILTPVGVADRKEESVKVDYNTFMDNVRKKALVQMFAPNNVYQLAAQIEKYLPKNKS
ncbi:hypothetical protein QQ054_32015 [Oscillatoria amoena NRMC-F 0135]|nr:hypothetical protein [Oscillatoria amoena NRMC-F 0135]